MAPERAHGSLRLTLGHQTTAEEIERTIAVVGACVARLRRTQPVAATA
jgi:cysteine sulfinate desulfinase/cysteine desulfurase-like protein